MDKYTQPISTGHLDEEVIVVSDKKEESSISRKRLDVKVVDPTLPVIDYTLVKKYSFQLKGVPKTFGTNKHESINQRVHESFWLYLLIVFTAIVISCMALYGIIDALVVFSQWNFT